MLVTLKTKIYFWLQLILREPTIIKNKFRKLLRKERFLFLVGTADYGNLGDQLINVGEETFLNTYFSDYTRFEYTHGQMMHDHKCRMLFSQIKKGDIIFLQGGGNLNDLYPNCEHIRRRVIRHCRNNPIILFPQSIFFRDTPQAKSFAKETEKVYSSHPNFLILARESVSYETAMRMFPHSDVRLNPDAATILFKNKCPTDSSVKRDGILLCLRTDQEKHYSDSALDALINHLQTFAPVQRTDTNIHRSVQRSKSETVTQEKINEFSKSRVVITDRFHGVIFAILANTPCVALKSCDHKISEGIKWFKDVPGVFFAENTEQAEQLAKQAYSGELISAPDFSKYFDSLYQIIKEHIGE